MHERGIALASPSPEFVAFRRQRQAGSGPRYSQTADSGVGTEVVHPTRVQLAMALALIQRGCYRWREGTLIDMAAPGRVLSNTHAKTHDGLHHPARASRISAHGPFISSGSRWLNGENFRQLSSISANLKVFLGQSSRLPRLRTLLMSQGHSFKDQSRNKSRQTETSERPDPGKIRLSGAINGHLSGYAGSLDPKCGPEGALNATTGRSPIVRGIRPGRPC